VSDLTITGYGSVFGTIDSYGDTIPPGAFAASLRRLRAAGRAPIMLSQHAAMQAVADDLVPIGEWQEFDEDRTGLKLIGRIFDTGSPRFAALHAALTSRALDGLSIGFRTVRSKIDESTGVRTLLEIDLAEVSIVTWPANDPARISSIRSNDVDSSLLAAARNRVRIFASTTSFPESSRSLERRTMLTLERATRSDAELTRRLDRDPTLRRRLTRRAHILRRDPVDTALDAHAAAYLASRRRLQRLIEQVYG
jgi:HK97 family phage prohead protease